MAAPRVGTRCLDCGGGGGSGEKWVILEAGGKIESTQVSLVGRSRGEGGVKHDDLQNFLDAALLNKQGVLDSFRPGGWGGHELHFEHCELGDFPDLPDKDTQDWSLDGGSGLEGNIL